MTDTQQQNLSNVHYESIQRLLSIPLIKDTLDYSQDLLHKSPTATIVFDKTYNIAVLVSKPIIDGPFSKPIHIVDGFSVQMLNLAQSFWPYPFEKHGNEIYKDFKLPFEQSKNKINERLVTPILMQIENFVHRFIPHDKQLQSAPDLSPTKRTILLSTEIKDYVTELSIDNLNKFRQSSDLVNKSSDYIYEQTLLIKKAVEQKRGDFQTLANDTMTKFRQEIEQLETRAENIPKKARYQIDPVLNQIKDSVNEIGEIAKDQSPPTERAQKIANYIQENGIPILNKLKEAVTNTEKEVEKTISEELNESPSIDKGKGHQKPNQSKSKKQQTKNQMTHEE